MRRVHHVYLAPGMFGFGKLASYDYFAHVERALVARFEAAGLHLITHVVDVAPTASIRRRAARLAELVARTSGDAPVHLVGHSTGGLDARLVASPSARLPVAASAMTWLPRLRSITMMSTPHYGTPLAGFFATVSGQRMLYAVSALTFIGLSLGAPPLAAAGALVVSLRSLDRAIGVELRVLDRTTEALMAALEPATSHQLRDYLEAIRKDQGAVIQLTPEAMDLFQAGVEDRAGVLYQSTCAAAPAPTARGLVRSLGSPWRALSSALFTTLYGISSRSDDRYPCSPVQIEPVVEARLREAFGAVPGLYANDGVVPTLSQVWGRVAWAGAADHLDVLGHFPGDAPTTTRTEARGIAQKLAGRVRGLVPDLLRSRTAPPPRGAGDGRDPPVAESAARVGGVAPSPEADAVHVDWLTSGAGFDRRAFDGLMDAISRGMLEVA